MKIDTSTPILGSARQAILFDAVSGQIGSGGQPLTIGAVIDQACRAPNPPKILPDGRVFPGDSFSLDENKKRFDWIDKMAVGGEVEASAQQLAFLQELIARAWTNVAIAGAAIRVLDEKAQWS